MKDVTGEKEGIFIFFLFYVCNYKWWVFNQHFCVLDVFKVKIKIALKIKINKNKDKDEIHLTILYEK